jgi:hypothetical protein
LEAAEPPGESPEKPRGPGNCGKNFGCREDRIVLISWGLIPRRSAGVKKEVKDDMMK